MQIEEPRDAMKRCPKYEDILARFVHGGVLLHEQEELERHLAVCPDCEALYEGIAGVDRALREMPGKLVDPPPHLRAKILANLPEREASRSAWGWGRWVAVGGAFAWCLLAFALFRPGVQRETRVASVPAPAGGHAAPVQPKDVRPSGNEAVVARPGPAPGVAQAPGMSVASTPQVQIIREVRVYFYYPPAHNVAVTGDFNGWDPEGVPLKAAGKPGLWETTLRLHPGAYSYNFIVDGNVLVPDPNAANEMPDGYGGTNSILLVRGDSA